MSSTSSKCLTQVKLELKTVIENLKLLDRSQISDCQQLKDLKQETEHILMNLEREPLEDIRSTLKKNQSRRQRKKLKRRHRQASNQQNYIDNSIESKHEHKPEQKPEHKPSISHINAIPIERSRKYHHHLRSLHECQRFLKTFELLEQLHLARGQDPSQTRRFSSKLQHLKLVWNCLLQEQQSEQSNNEQQIQQQWNQVLFGMSEKTYFEGRTNLKYFLRKRHIWDSYIDSKHGTYIPIGWVLPSMKPNNEWSEYLAK